MEGAIREVRDCWWSLGSSGGYKREPWAAGGTSARPLAVVDERVLEGVVGEAARLGLGDHLRGRLGAEPAKEPSQTGLMTDWKTAEQWGGRQAALRVEGPCRGVSAERAGLCWCGGAA